MDDYIKLYLEETAHIAANLDREQIGIAISLFKHLQASEGRLFILGVGGSAGNASHAVNDFRKIAGIEAYAPTDNVSELTAWVNDASWAVTMQAWLMESHLCASDMLLIFSVGGGSDTTSPNLVAAMNYGKQLNCKMVAIVSRDGGKARELVDVTILIPVIAADRVTPHAEEMQAVVWHLIVNALKTR